MSLLINQLINKLPNQLNDQPVKISTNKSSVD